METLPSLAENHPSPVRHPRARRFWTGPALLLLALFGLFGCSNNPNPEEWTREGDLYFAIAQEPVSFDPTVSYTAGDAIIMDLVYPQYYRFNFLKENPWSLELNLGLIDPVRQTIRGVSDGKPYVGESWTFELRHDVLYQDDPCFPGGKGRPVTAKDMEYTIKRMADPSVEFPLTANLQDKLLGWDDYQKGFKKYGNANFDRPLEGVELDPRNPFRFTVKFTQKYPQWKYIMAMHFTTPIPREAVEKYGDGFTLHHPVGCGPFLFQEYTPQFRVVLARNPNCTWDRYPTTEGPGVSPALLADAGKPLPLVNRIIYRIVSEDVTSYNLFDEGYLDTLGLGQGNAQFLLKAVKPGAEMVQRGVKMLTGAYPSISYCVFNMKDPVFGGYTPEKRKLRQAISLSIDSGQYIDLIDQGLAKDSEFMLPRGLCGYDPDYKNPYRQYDPSLTKAKQLLAEAGYPGGVDSKTGKRLVLTMDNIKLSAIDSARARFFIKEIESLGIDVREEDENVAQFQDKINHGEFQLYQWGWIADYPDSEDFLMLLAGPNSPNPNNAQYQNPDYDRLFDQVRSMDDSPERAALIHKMRDIAVEDCPWIYLDENEAPGVYQPWVTNQYRNPMLNDPAAYHGVDIDKRLKFQASRNDPIFLPILAILGICVAGLLPGAATVRAKSKRRVLRPASTKERRR